MMHVKQVTEKRYSPYLCEAFSCNGLQKGLVPFYSRVTYIKTLFLNEPHIPFLTLQGTKGINTLQLLSGQTLLNLS